jgi:outer membrane lipase/esterase
MRPTPPFILALALIGVVMSSEALSAPRYERIVVIGDSLSDMGNAGRFSNGPVWVEQLAERLQVPLRPSEAGGTNFAIGGARLDPASGPSALPAQVERLAQRDVPAQGTLFIVFGGGNDLLAAVGDPEGEAMVSTAALALQEILLRLVKAGATDILVPNLPDVGMTPAVRAYGGAARRRARALSERFRRDVEAVVDGVARRLAGSARIVRLDVWALAERTLARPGDAGFTNVTEPCQMARSCEGALFWDGVHPTSYAHGRLAAAALAEIGTP